MSFPAYPAATGLPNPAENIENSDLKVLVARIARKGFKLVLLGDASDTQKHLLTPVAIDRCACFPTTTADSEWYLVRKKPSAPGGKVQYLAQIPSQQVF